MSTLNHLVGAFFWKPAGFVSSLDDWSTTDGVVGKQDITEKLAGSGSVQHRLLVVELAGGKVIGDLRLSAAANNVVAGGLQSLFGSTGSQGHYLLRRRRLRVPKFWHGTALLLGTTSSDNYYHWMLDSLPRWKMLQVAGWNSYDHVLLPAKTAPIQDEILDRLGVPPAKRLRCSKNFVHQFERLVVPAMPFPLEEVSAWACAWVRSLFPQKNVGPEKIYLRRGRSRRQIMNEAELETMLAGKGFEIVEPDRLTVAQQAEILGAARCVVAPHGAALTNLVFSPPGALLLELFHPQHKNRCYINLAAACGHRYASMEGRAVGQAKTGQLDYALDVPAVSRLFDKNF